jgi:uncharacterized protein (DUF1800 family)
MEHEEGEPMKTTPLGRAGCGLLALSLAVPGGAARAAARPQPPLGDAQIVHVLNRLGFGPRPGDVDRVRRMGIDKWIEQQLEPTRAGDAVLAEKLAGLKTASLSSAELLEKYEIPREARREIQKKRAELGENPSEEAQQKLRRELMAKYAGQMEGRPRQVLDELQAAKLLRAVYSERQLDEVLVDFWMNHFNVFAGKGPLRFVLGEYERDVIRPHAWGRFEDLLKATAESPAMLFYLDNWLSVDPQAAEQRDQRRMLGRARRPGRGRAETAAQPPPPARRRGLNENYAREIMELHTLGVDGGYTQKDVTEVARCFTGWTIEGLRQQRPTFAFDQRMHDRGDKVVLGRTVKSGGKEEGDQIIHLLATHPATARFIAGKLARRLVADEPPPALVDRAAETFRKTDGLIREVVRTIVTSPEFQGPDHRGAKVKTPFELVASAVRASGADVTDARDLVRRVAAMGMPLYMQQPPTGYKDTSDAWVSTSGLLARLNFSLDLMAGRIPGVATDAARLAPRAADADDLAQALATALLPGELSESTRQTLAGEAGSGLDAQKVAGLILGSPEFQRR